MRERKKKRETTQTGSTMREYNLKHVWAWTETDCVGVFHSTLQNSYENLFWPDNDELLSASTTVLACASILWSSISGLNSKSWSSFSLKRLAASSLDLYSDDDGSISLIGRCKMQKHTNKLSTYKWYLLIADSFKLQVHKQWWQYLPFRALYLSQPFVRSPLLNYEIASVPEDVSISP